MSLIRSSVPSLITATVLDWVTGASPLNHRISGSGVPWAWTIDSLVFFQSRFVIYIGHKVFILGQRYYTYIVSIFVHGSHGHMVLDWISGNLPLIQSTSGSHNQIALYPKLSFVLFLLLICKLSNPNEKSFFFFVIFEFLFSSLILFLYLKILQNYVVIIIYLLL